MSFRLKIVLGLLAIQILLAAMLIWSSLAFLRASNEVELSSRAQVLAPGLAALMRPAVAALDMAELERDIEAVLFRRGVVYVRIVSPQGKTLIERGEAAALAKPFAEDFLFEDVNDGVFDVHADIERDGARIGRIELGLAVDEIQEIMVAARREMASIALLGLALSVVFSWLLGNYFANQLMRLRDATRRVAAGDIGYQLPVAGSDELAQTANAFNTMSRKLAALYAEKQAALNAAHQTAGELRESEHRVHAVLDNAMDAIFTFDAQGVIESFNPAAERIFGRAAAEAVGRRLDTIIAADDYAAFEQRLRDFDRTGDAGLIVEEGEIGGLRKQGEVFPMEIDIGQMQIAGRHLFIAIARDVTQRRQADAALRRAQSAALESSRSKFEFIAGVSDEIRVPVGDMLGALGALSRSAVGDEQYGRVERAVSAGNALITVVSDMLDFARMEAGTLELESIDFDLWQIIDAVCRTYRERAAAKGVELVYVAPGDLPAALRGDPARLRQLLVNLVDNAVKFTARGAVVLSVGVQAGDEGRVTLHFEVEDTGSGIAPELQHHIFDFAGRERPAEGAPHASAGLGLMVSRRLVEMMQGEIGVSSEPGQGSRFWFTAVFERRAIHAGSPPCAPALAADEALRGLRVLLASSDAALRASWRAMLDDAGMTLAEARDDGEAIEILRAAAAADGRAYHALVCGESGAGGARLAHAVGADASTASVRVIMLAASGYRGDGEEARAAGVRCYLSGAVEARQLRDAIAAAVLGDPAQALLTRHDLDGFHASAGHTLLLSGNEERCRRLLATLQAQGLRAAYAVDVAQARLAVAATRHELLLVDNEDGGGFGVEAVRSLCDAVAAGQVQPAPVIAVLLPAGADRECAAWRAAGADVCAPQAAGAAFDARAWLAAAVR
jgi:PAS domain S-box-containing protein